ncbi:hypothetical protein KPL39_14955 [Clostridium gasigenes]|uniref:hypothetical protein n=1 Tax=Clostridium gasigenes TaxID=94869 RepID=UPI001C0E84BA|nr:hypothetical protein [Clostridium gasigenes]MBU3137562.1 hypothetical protein [Clostridium gasigenes]
MITDKTKLNIGGKTVALESFITRYNVATMDEAIYIAGLLVKQGKATILKNEKKNNTITKKYELTNEFIEYDGRKLYRIKALRSFNNIEVNDLGGYIEKEENLDHESNAWVDGHEGWAAYVYGNARVYENAIVRSSTKVYGNAQVYGDADISGGNQIYGNAQVYGNAKVYTSAQVYGNAKVHGNAEIAGDAQVYGDADIFGDGELRDGKYKSTIELHPYHYKNNRSYGEDEDIYPVEDFMRDNGYDPENDSVEDMYGID